jgi:hypothetical protein
MVPWQTLEYINKIIMQWTLTCENGKQIDMTYYIGRQMEGEITRADVEERIKFYQLTNKKK